MKEVVKRKLIEVEVECDTKILYDSLDRAIKYLQEIRDAYPNTNITLAEKWEGYEDMHMAFTYSRLENDKEYGERIAQEMRERAEAERKAKEQKERDKRRKQYERLKREFG